MFIYSIFGTALMNIRLTFYLILLLDGFAFSQSQPSNNPNLSSYKIVWNSPSSVKISETETQHFLSFIGAHYDYVDDFLPRYNQKLELINNEQSFSASLVNASYEPLSNEEIAIIQNPTKIENEITVQANILTSQKKSYGIISFIPIRKNSGTGKFEKLISFELSVTPSTSFKSSLRSARIYAANSVLQSGDWYKIAITSDGIYKLSFSFLQSLGMDMSTINPKNIRIYGNGGGMLPELNSTPRPDDIVENAVYVNDGGDNVFNVNDYVLFYGKGPNTWSYNSTVCPNFTHALNLYSDSAYYFITTDLGAGKRIQTQASSALPVTHTVTGFDDYAFHENDNVNFIQSGRQWFGEYFENNPSYNFSFVFPNIDGSFPVTVKATIASRCFTSAAIYSVSSQSGSTSLSIASTTADPLSDYAEIGSGCFAFNPNSSTITVNVTKQTADAVAWLDYIEVNARRQLTMSGNQMIFRDMKSIGSGNIAQYNLTGSLPIQIWDITDIANVQLQEVTVSGANNQFTLPADILKQFIAFTGLSYNIPTASGKVINQNLHALSNKDFIIIAYPDFEQEAMQLAAYHENADALSAIVVTPQQIYNEFSSGAQDIAAIRDFVKMFYDKAGSANESPKYLLLFGDGSYDYKNRVSSNTNYIPTYESDNSTVPTASYVSDDWYGLLDDNEGLWTNDAVDIGIGRFPMDTKSEAQTAVNKVLNYVKTGVPSSATSSMNSSCSNKAAASCMGNWRNTICFMADDDDQDLHIGQADQLATLVDTTYKNYNIDKIYLDAYQQQAVPGGDRYPGAVDAINERIAQGSLIINWTGHGGVFYLSHKRIIDIPQINSWNNLNKLFLFYTASCEVSRYDDPARVSAGEDIFLNPNGGAIALFSTVRVVYADQNFTLNSDFYNAAFKPNNGKMPRLGDLYQYIKTQSGGNSVNSRNFTLLGDPALTLAYPKYNIATDTINNVAVTASSLDTIKALAIVTISGHLKDNSGALLSTYNGFLYPTVYDKSQSITTLSNDGAALSPPFTFKIQKNILYNGKESVTNGSFRFSFIVPKDIAYQYGIGRISYYAENGNEDANGYYEKILIGGTNDKAIADVVGPDVNLYLDDAKFVFGGLTDEKPDLYSVLKDASGINTVGNGIGHDITAVLDGNIGNAIVLNDYYQADLNTYKSGTIRYPFLDLSEGKHTLNLKVWDVYNNSSQAYTEFIVAKSAQLALSHVLNYPNPFTTKTQFYFEHNRACSLLDVQIQVFTVSGKLVKNINQFVNTDGFRSEPIEWDGRDDFGDKIGRGVYVYRIKVKTSDGSAAEKYEKLVILN